MKLRIILKKTFGIGIIGITTYMLTKAIIYWGNKLSLIEDIGEIAFYGGLMIAVGNGLFEFIKMGTNLLKEQSEGKN